MFKLLENTARKAPLCVNLAVILFILKRNAAEGPPSACYLPPGGPQTVPARTLLGVAKQGSTITALLGEQSALLL